jgi:hypothetical protein
VRRTTTIGWITRCTSQPARTTAACTDSTRNGMSSVTISTIMSPSSADAAPSSGFSAAAGSGR